MSARDIRPGEVLRLDRLGPIVPDEGHDVVALFLGACRLGDEPDAVAYLRQLGFARTHVFELCTFHRDEDREWTEVEQFSAATPRAALEAAVRRVSTAGEEVVALDVRLLSIGEVDADGRPTTRRGQAFVRWSIFSGVPLSDLLKAT